MNIVDRLYAVNKTKGPAGLARMRRLLELLGNPEKDLKIIHVGGTNGKGSVSFYVKSILNCAGYSVGAFTSPHLEVFNERIQVDDRMISDEDLNRIADSVLQKNSVLESEGYGGLSFFEAITATAYLYFSERKVDYAIIEAGIGAMLDVTNTVEEPVCTVLTQIGLDHTDILGETVEEIARDKAHIVKPGVPIISESAEREIKEIIREAALKNNSEFIDASAFDCVTVDESLCEIKAGTVFTADVCGKHFEKLEISMLGEHQVANAIVAIAASLVSADVTEDNIREGLKTAFNPGRFEILQDTKPYIILDGAHNANGVKAAVSTYEKLFGNIVPRDKLLVVYGCLKDKKYDKMMDILSESFKGADFLALEPESDRAVPATEIRDMFEKRGCSCNLLTDKELLFDAERMAAYDAVLVLGSIYLIGDVKSLYMKGSKIHV